MCARGASVCFGKQQIDGLHQLALGLTTDALKKEPLSVDHGDPYILVNKIVDLKSGF